MANHPLVRLISECFEGDVDDPGRFDNIQVWLDAHRDEATPLLVQLAADRSLLRETTLANGEVSIAATYFLGSYPDPAAIEPALGLLCSMPHAYPEMMQWDAVWEILLDMPELVMEPAIERYQRSDDPAHRAILAVLLGDVGCTDTRARDIWIAELPQRPCLMATYLGLHSHKPALPVLLETFDALSWDSSGEFGAFFAGQPMLDLCDAITAVSGELSSEQWDKYRSSWQRRAPTQPPPSIVPPPARKAFPDHRSWLPPAEIVANDVVEFHEKGLTIYGTLRNAADMLGASPGMIFHYTDTLARLM